MQRRFDESHQAGDDDVRLLRVHLMSEELAETVDAMAAGDELELLDGLADLLYVTYGTAVHFEMPLDDAFEEVHDANMSKTYGAWTDRGGNRGKGGDYRPPDLAAVLAERKGGGR